MTAKTQSHTPEQSTCPRNQWHRDHGKQLRAEGWRLRKIPPKWDAENALIERGCVEASITLPAATLASVRAALEAAEKAFDGSNIRLAKEHVGALGLVRAALASLPKP